MKHRLLRLWDRVTTPVYAAIALALVLAYGDDAWGAWLLDDEA